MRMSPCALALALALALAVVACGPARSPRGPGGDARVLRYAIVTSGRPSGAGELRSAADGTRVSHYTFNDRGRGPDVTAAVVLDEHGAPRWFRATGHAYEKQPIDERVDTDDEGGDLRWKSSAEAGHAPAGAGFFLPTSGTLTQDADLARALLHAPGHHLTLLPAGEARVDDDHVIEVELGGATRRLHQVAIAGLDFTPEPLWLDEDDELFAITSPWISVIRAGAEPLIPRLLAADQAWLAARDARLAATLAHRPPAAGLAITHARVFDGERETFVSDATVVVIGDRITAVGDASTPVPAGARVIDARGRTLLPGLWDMHVHLTGGDGIRLLASGVTTVRDMGNDIDDLTARVARFDAGTELGPRVLRAGLIDGPGKLAAPIGLQADTTDDAKAAVARYAGLGYVQIKMYSSLRPALVPVIADAAHALGLRVSGHIPNGMNAAEAVLAGYDEIQHVNFLFLRFLAGPGDDTRTPLRYVRVAERGAELDLGGKDVSDFLDLLALHHTVIDPTVSVFEGQFVDEPGDLDPGLAPYAGRLPAQVERGARGGGLDAHGKRATFRASFAALLKMIKLAWDRKITIVAGTDRGGGLPLSRELELYVRAGIPPADVLALDTIGAARVMKIDHDIGSIAIGKGADLVLVAGDPLADMGAVRNTDVVVCRGLVYDPAELFAAVGMRPHR